MSPVTNILTSDTVNGIAIGMIALATALGTWSAQQKLEYDNKKSEKELQVRREEFKAKQEEFKATQQMEARRFQLEAEKARSQHALELTKALKNNEITRESFIELTQKNPSNLKAISNEAESKVSTDASVLANGAETSQTATEQSELVSIDKDLSLNVDKDSFQKNGKNEKSLALYADITDSDNTDFTLKTSMGKQQVVPKEQYLIGVNDPKVEEVQNTLPEQVSTPILPIKPLKPKSQRGNGGLPFASASLSRTPIGIRQSSLYGKGNGEEMHLAPPSSKSLWELERSSSSSNNVYSSLLPLALLALALIQQVLIKLNKIQKQINDLTG